MASGFSTINNEFLIHTDLWSRQIRENLKDELFAMKFVRVLTEFPHGETFNIPSIGEAETADFVEGQAIKYNKWDEGNFQFQFDQYKYSANAISEKFKRDSFYSDSIISSFAPEQHFALMKAVETRILSRGPEGQTAGNLNMINGQPHRWVGSGTDETLALQDFFKAQLALTVAKVPLRNLVAIVDPTVAYTIQTQTNVMNLLSPMPMWEKVVKDGMVTGLTFRFNLAGFDVYVSNFLPSVASETIDGKTVTNGVANQFFAAVPGDLLPIIGGFRQMPTLHYEFNKDKQQHEFVTIAEYGFKLYRPENMVVILTDKDV